MASAREDPLRFLTNIASRETVSRLIKVPGITIYKIIGSKYSAEYGPGDTVVSTAVVKGAGMKETSELARIQRLVYQ